MKDAKVKFPKQWPRWLEKAGLRHTGKYKRNWWSKGIMVGYNRHWRVNCHGYLDVSCLKNDFDRWANSNEASAQFVGVITNEQEFVSLVRNLLATTRSQKDNYEPDC